MLHFYCIRPFKYAFLHTIQILLSSENKSDCHLWIILTKEKQSPKSPSHPAPPKMIFLSCLSQLECAARGTGAVLSRER